MKKWLLAGAAAALFRCRCGGTGLGRIQGRSIAAARCAFWRAQAGGTLDPHINYTLQYWQIYQPTL